MGRLLGTASETNPDADPARHPRPPSRPRLSCLSLRRVDKSHRCSRCGPSVSRPWPWCALGGQMVRCGAPLVRAGIRLGGGARCGALPASVSCSCWARLLVFRRVLRLLCCASCRAGGCVRLAVRAVALAARSCRVPRSLAPWVLHVCCGTGARRSRRRPPRQTPKAKSVRLCSRVGVLDVRVVLHNVAHICEQKTTAIARTLPCVAMAEVRPPQTRFSEGNSG